MILLELKTNLQKGRNNSPVMSRWSFNMVEVMTKIYTKHVANDRGLRGGVRSGIVRILFEGCINQ
jgi:hypothetical protein